MPKTRNSEVLEDFVRYCRKHPEMRFWQALRNWSGFYEVLVTNMINLKRDGRLKDTFSWEGKDK